MTDRDNMSQTRRFAGWNRVAEILRRTSLEEGGRGWSLNDGQRRSLRALAERLPQHGVLIADEVGMGKTRIAVALARSLVEAGGRVAILIPPGLGFQWQKELRDGDLAGVDFCAASMPSPWPHIAARRSPPSPGSGATLYCCLTG
jgi:hypothetical protein